jgi:hypothetical protein
MDMTTIENALQDTFFDRSGEPITLQQWLELRSDDTYRSVARTTLAADGDTVDVITVWMGTDQRDGADDAPAVFGTIARRGDVWLDELEQFSSDETAAAAAHEQLVDELRAA